MFRAVFAVPFALCAALAASAAGADPAMLPPGKVDSVLLSAAELNQISAQDSPAYGGHNFNSDPSGATRQPEAADPSQNACGSASRIGGASTFGGGWTAFRSLFAIGGSNNAGVHLVVAVYPDPQAAQQVFSRIAQGLATCSGKTTVDATAPNAARWRNSFFYAPGGVDSQTYDEARLVENVVLEVEAESLFQNPGAAVTAVADRMAQHVQQG